MFGVPQIEQDEDRRRRVRISRERVGVGRQAGRQIGRQAGR